MRNYIVYFLTSLFLLFIVESKINVKTLHNHLPVSHHLPKKANRLNQTYDKLSIQQMPDGVDNSSLELTEEDFQWSDSVQDAILFVGVFGLVYFFGLFNYKKLKARILGYVSNYSSVKKFILIRSIRI
ncbi:hypothetical protein [Chryseobacterium proteolyticum]|uniref:hypothetical protein n=1 Tax=Chryseobacterium proteolyticum TaxID=118127 RepID=UPI003983DA88